MKVDNIIKSDRVTISFEVFPPKGKVTTEDIEQLSNLCSLKPSYISCTYGAGGGTRETSLEIEKIIQAMSIPAVAHLTCGHSTESEVEQLVDEVCGAGIENILALRGDELKEDGFEYATKLIEYIRKRGVDWCIGAACYPEKFPESSSQELDIEVMRYKSDLGCNFFTTQMFFDNNIYYNFMYKVRSAGIKTPVVPGIMPIISPKQMEKSIKLSGSMVTKEIKSIMDKYSLNKEAMKQAGIIYATNQIVDLLANGEKHIHLYTMNNYSITKGILDNLKGII